MSLFVRLSTRLCILLAAVLVATFSTLASAAAPTAPIPVSDFVRRGQFSNPLLSPDGLHLVVNHRVQIEGRDVSLIVVYELADMKIMTTVRLPVFGVPAGYWWVSNSRLVVTTAREYGSLIKPQLTGDILAMDIDGSHQEYLYGYRYGERRRTMVAADHGIASVNKVPDSLNGHFFMTENLWGVKETTSYLYDVDSMSTARHLVAEVDRQDFDFIVQSDGVPRFAYGEDDQGFLSVLRFDDQTRHWQELPTKDKANLQPIFISSDNRSFIARKSTGGGPRALVRQSLESGDRTTLAQDKVGDMDMVERSTVDGPFAAATAVDVPAWQYFDEGRPEAQLHKLLSSQFPGEVVHFVNFSRDGNKLLFSVASDRDPGAFYLLDRTSNKATVLFEQQPWTDPARMAERRAIQFKARDGLELHGYLTLPREPAKGRLPLILLPHGGPHQIADHWFFDSDAQFLASRGYAVLQVNYRGSGGRGQEFENAGHRQWGGLMQTDLIDGVRWAIEQGTADAARVCAYGGSFGAYSAMMVAIREPGMFKCVVGYSGLYDLAQIYGQDETVESKRNFNYWVEVIGQDQAELAAFSPSRQAEKLTVPVLLVHGSEDSRTPPKQAKTMREALIKAGRPPEWLFVEGEGHGFYAEKNRQAFYEKLESFLAKHLAKPAP